MFEPLQEEVVHRPARPVHEDQFAQQSLWIIKAKNYYLVASNIRRGAQREKVM